MQLSTDLIRSINFKNKLILNTDEMAKNVLIQEDPLSPGIKWQVDTEACNVVYYDILFFTENHDF